MDHLGERRRVVEDIKRGRKGTRRKEIVEQEREGEISWSVE
jgi:hypothetical protein